MRRIDEREYVTMRCAFYLKKTFRSRPQWNFAKLCSDCSTKLRRYIGFSHHSCCFFLSQCVTLTVVATMRNTYPSPSPSIFSIHFCFSRFALCECAQHFCSTTYSHENQVSRTSCKINDDRFRISGTPVTGKSFEN